MNRQSMRSLVSQAESASPIRLRRLSLVGTNGLCNRLRAIASARRLCAILSARCSIVWDWGEYTSLFEPCWDVTLVRHPRDVPDKVITHHPYQTGGQRLVDVGVRSVRLYSGYVFWGSHESPITLQDVMPYFPVLNARLQRAVDEFSAARLENAVGFHIRRTDNHRSTNRSPDELFLRLGRRVVESGRKVFLATDNLATEALMKQSLGEAVITYPKRQQMEIRWPRSFDQTATEDDLIELYLLAKTQCVFGSFWSSYSRVAIALNGSSKSKILDRRGWVERWLRARSTRLLAAGARRA